MKSVLNLPFGFSLFLFVALASQSYHVIFHRPQHFRSVGWFRPSKLSLRFQMCPPWTLFQKRTIRTRNWSVFLEGYLRQLWKIKKKKKCYVITDFLKYLFHRVKTRHHLVGIIWYSMILNFSVFNDGRE